MCPRVQMHPTNIKVMNFLRSTRWKLYINWLRKQPFSKTVFKSRKPGRNSVFLYISVKEEQTVQKKRLCTYTNIQERNIIDDDEMQKQAIKERRITAVQKCFRGQKKPRSVSNRSQKTTKRKSTYSISSFSDQGHWRSNQLSLI